MKSRWLCQLNGSVEKAAEADDEKQRGEADDGVAHAEAREQSGGEDSGKHSAERPEGVERGERGASVGAITAAGEDVGGSNELAEAETSEEERDGCRRQAMAESKRPEAAAAEHAPGEYGEAQARKDGDTSEKGAEEFCADEDAALSVRELPLVEKDGQDRTEQNCAEASEDESRSEPESGGAEAAVVGG